MHALPSSVDCLVAGGGPAGAALAGLLAQRGARVLLVDDGHTRTAAPLETLLPSSLQAFERCGLGELVRSAAEPDRRRHGARWDTEAWQWREDPRPGLCLRRARFDEALRDFAVRAGAHVLRPARLESRLDDVSTYAIRIGADTMRIRARSLVLASGRNARLDRFDVKTAASGPPTAALCVSLGTGSDLGTEATVTATRSGWCWTIGDGSTRGLALVCFDAEEESKPARAMADAILREAGVVHEDESLRLVGAVRATVGRREAPLGTFLLGDAAAGLDPLASQGTEKALVGAEHLAALLAHALQRPDDAWLAAASACHAQWEEDLYEAHVRTTAGFYARVTRFASEPFWERRRRVERDAPIPMRLVCADGLVEHSVLARSGRDVDVVRGFGRDLRHARARVGRAALEPLLRAFAKPTDVERGIAEAGQDARLFPLGTAVVRAAIGEAVRLRFLVEA